MNPNIFDTPPKQPFDWLKQWLDDAAQAGLNEPMAMNLATVSASGAPSSRIVLFKQMDADSIYFYTNYQSRKGTDLAANVHGALCFWWDPLMRQIRIEGPVEKIPADQSDQYFASRDRGSRVGAWASQQSQPIADRQALEQAFHAAEKRFHGQSVPRPPHWGGYKLRIDLIEFWQGRKNRFHDRTQYVRDAQAWTIERLQP